MGRHSASEPDEPAKRVSDTHGLPALALLTPSLLDLIGLDPADEASAKQERDAVGRAQMRSFTESLLEQLSLPESLPAQSSPDPAATTEESGKLAEPDARPLPHLPSQRRVTISMPLPVVETEPEVEVVIATPVRRIQPIELSTRPLPEVPLRTEPATEAPERDSSESISTAHSTLPSGAASRVPRLLVGWAEFGRPAGLAQHLRVHGELPREKFAGRDGAMRLVELTERAGLRGRGGSGFPTGTKMRAVLDAAATRRAPVVVANGCEGDLTSGKDNLLLHGAPHLVLDGLALAAHAVGADQAILCVHRGSPALDSIEQAIAERTEDPCELHLVTTPTRYVSSEASALVNFLTTGDARPTTAPPLPAERGVQGRPTLVDNVETLAHLALLARGGAEWFRSRGTESSPGTMLVTLDGAVHRTGVYEVDMGTRIGQLVRMAGGATSGLQAALLGGLGGSWLPLPAEGNLPLGYDECRAAGAGLGVASLVLLPVDACGVGVTSVIVNYLAGESAGQCGPCMFGLPAIAQDFGALAAGSTDPELAERLDRRLGVIARRGACAHPDGAVRLAASALRVFASDVAHHLRGHHCGRPVEAAMPLLSELPELVGGWR